MIRRFALLVGLLLLNPAAAAPVSFPESRASLVAEVITATPGQTLRAGLLLELEPGWHSYWENPGDSGLATDLEWSLPPGVTAGPIVWPAPERHVFGPLVNHGYSGRVLLPVEIRIPATAAGEVRLVARASWLVCRDICIPREADLTLTLPVDPVAYASEPDVLAAFAAADATMPRPSPWAVTATQAGSRLSLTLAAGLGTGATVSGHLFARDPGRLVHNAAQQIRVVDGALQIDAVAAASRSDGFEAVLVLTQTISGVARRDALAITVPPPAAGSDLGLIAALALAVLGGLVLNLMPCVFPVLSMKVIGLVQVAHDRPALRRHALGYTIGVLLSFLMLALALAALRAAGQQLGWGFQFQAPGFVLVMSWVMAAVALGLVMEGGFGAAFSGLGERWTRRTGWSGSVATGALAVVVATPCTAPFMGAALGWALAQDSLSATLVLQALGLGLALPTLILALVPQALAILPRPGAWMVVLKQALAFPMAATAAWLIWVLARQAGPDAVLVALAGIVALGWIAWVPAGRWRWLARLPAVAALAAAFWFGHASPPPSRAETQTAWSDARVADLQAAGTPVFVDVTADWCITCLVNERGALAAEPVRAAFGRAGVVLLVADWTRPDTAISALLARHSQPGVPLYLMYPGRAGAAPEVLPQILTESILLQAISRARPGT